MQVNNVNLEISAVEPKQYPHQHLPEIALVGRSNVGKSSLTNVLINRRNYAHTSSQPGKTQTLNFYNVDDKMYFVDIPGYGFAKVSKTERERWANMIDTYLTKRAELRGIIQLIDGRHAPTQNDLQMAEWLAYFDLPCLLVPTKMDKVARGKWNQESSLVRQKMGKLYDQMILFSAATKTGKDQIWQWIEQVINK